MPTARLTDRAVLAVGGTDARDFLQGLVTHDVATVSPATPRWAGLLSAQGKPLFDMILHDDGSDILIDVLASAAEALARRLTMYRLRRAVTIAPRPDLAVFAAWDGAGRGHPADPQLAALGRRWLAPGTTPTDAAVADYAGRRRGLGVADSADLLVDRMLWLEANAVELNGVSFTKGCYVGQENTARMHHRDRLRRRLLPVTLDGEPGDAVVTARGIAVGELRGHAAGRGIAYLKVEAAGGPLTAGGVAVAVDWPDWLPPG